MNNVANEDDEEALELEVHEGEMLNYTMQKILLAPRFEEDNQCNKISEHVAPSKIRCAT